MKKRRHLLLVALSTERERILRADPELVRDLVGARTKTPIPGSLEVDERWIDLQRALFDFQGISGTDDARAEALTPRSGLDLYADRDIDSARVVSAERARSIGDWVKALPPDCIERAQRAPRSPAAREFPQSLGTSEADDQEPLVEGTTTFRESAPYDVARLSATLAQVRAFYAEVLRSERGVLAIRFRN